MPRAPGAVGAVGTSTFPDRTRCAGSRCASNTLRSPRDAGACTEARGKTSRCRRGSWRPAAPATHHRPRRGRLPTPCSLRSTPESEPGAGERHEAITTVDRSHDPNLSPRCSLALRGPVHAKTDAYTLRRPPSILTPRQDRSCYLNTHGSTFPLHPILRMRRRCHPHHPGFGRGECRLICTTLRPASSSCLAMRPRAPDPQPVPGRESQTRLSTHWRCGRMQSCAVAKSPTCRDGHSRLPRGRRGDPTGHTVRRASISTERPGNTRARKWTRHGTAERSRGGRHFHRNSRTSSICFGADSSKCCS